MPELKNRLIRGIYNGKVTPKNPPKYLYKNITDKFIGGVEKGFSNGNKKVLALLKENIYNFSSAKTLTQTIEMHDALTGEDGKRSFTEYEQVAGDIFDKYESWGKTEYDTIVGQSRMADKWGEIEKNKDQQPFLMYKTTEGEEVCEICAPLDNIILPADDEFWDDNYPENHFHCNCTVIQMDEQDANENGGVDEPEEIQKYVEQSHENKNPLFSNNVGKTGQIFREDGKSKHPYFDN